MVSWSRVNRVIREHLGLSKIIIPEGEDPLRYIYRLGVPSAQIAAIPGIEVHQVTLIRRLRQLGVDIKPRGGTQRMKKVPMTREEYEELNIKELAAKYNVSCQRIYKEAKNQGWPHKRELSTLPPSHEGVDGSPGTCS